MRGVLIALVLCVAFAPSSLAHAPHDPILAVALSPDFARDRTLFVGVKGFSLLLRSTDGGESFHPIQRGLSFTFVSSIAVSPDFVHDRSLWVTNGRELAVSRDAGESWMPLRLPLEKPVGYNALLAIDGKLLLATTAGLLSVSDPHSDQPTEVSLSARPRPLLALSVLPAQLDVAPPLGHLLTHDGEALFLSLDHGENLLRLTLPNGERPSAVHLIQVGVDDARLWVGTQVGHVYTALARKPDWQRVGDALLGGAVLSFTDLPNENSTGIELLATTSAGGVQALRNGSWKAQNDGLRELSKQSNQHHLSVVASPNFARDGVLFLATFEGLHRKRAAQPWEWLTVLPPTIIRDLQLSAHFADDSRLFVCGYGDGLLQSDDHGAHFRKLDSGSWLWPDGVGVSPDFATDGTLLLGGPTRQLISRDAGESWKPVFSRKGTFLDRVRFAPDFATSGEIFAQLLFFSEVAHNEFVISRDRGVTWAPHGPALVSDFALGPDYPSSGQLWLATASGLLVSQDRGASFNEVSTPFAKLMAVSAERHDESILLCVASVRGEVAVSQDAGASWNLAKLPAGVWLLESARDAAGTVQLFAGTRTAGVLRSMDAGATWFAVHGGPQCVFALDVSRQFSREPAVLAAGYNGPWLSRDAGVSWTLLDIASREKERSK